MMFQVVTNIMFDSASKGVGSFDNYVQEESGSGREGRGNSGRGGAEVQG